jgi:hypothetical protein
LNLSGTTVKSVTDAVTAGTVSDKTGYSLSGTQTFNVTGNISGNLSGSVGSVTSAVTVGTNNDKTGYSLTSGPLDAAGVRSAVGLASANLDTQLAKLDTIDDFLDTEIAAIKAKTDLIPASPASVGDIPTAVQVRQEIDANSTQIQAIKAKTDNLPSDPADASNIAASFTSLNTKVDTIDDFLDTEVAAIKAKTDLIPADPADASDIAASFATVNSTLSTIAGYVDTEVAAIKGKTDLIPASPAAVSDIPTTAQIATAIGSRQATESYAADGTVPTYDQFLFMIWAVLAQFAISGTTISAKKLNGSDEAMTFALDSSSAPTSRTRAT